jgi:hypothetical protein
MINEGIQELLGWKWAEEGSWSEIWTMNSLIGEKDDFTDDIG